MGLKKMPRSRLRGISEALPQFRAPHIDLPYARGNLWRRNVVEKPWRGRFDHLVIQRRVSRFLPKVAIRPFVFWRPKMGVNADI